MNTDIKNAYLEEYKKMNNTIEYRLGQQFDRIAWYEDELGKDVCNFTLEDILEYYTFLNTSSMQLLIVINNRFSNYTRWCLTRGLVPTGMNHYQEVTPELLEKCINKNKVQNSVMNYKEFEEVIATIEHPRDAFMLYAFFEGLSDEDIIRLKMSDFISKTQLKLSNGEIIPVDESFYEYALLANASYEMVMSNGRSKELFGDRVFKIPVNTIASLHLVYDEEYEDYISIDLSHITYKIKVPSNAIGFKIDSLCMTKIIAYMCKRVLNIAVQLDNNNITKLKIRNAGLIRYIKTFDDGSGDWWTVIHDNKSDIFKKYGTIMSIKNFVLKYQDVLGV